LEAADILRRSLAVEYRFIFWYPELERLMPDQDTAEKVKALGQASVGHATKVSQALTTLGEIPTVPTMEALPEPLDLEKFFRLQLEYERLAMWLHNQAARLVPAELAPHFQELAKEEQHHITLTEEICTALEQLPDYEGGASAQL
jgi:rubrerythrin